MSKHNKGRLYTDTDPKIEAMQIQMWREAPPIQKMKVGELTRASRMLALMGLRDQYPDADEDELRYRLAVRLYGEELARRAYKEPDNSK